MPSHQDALIKIRQLLKARWYSEALQTGRLELDQERDSPDLLILMATAGQLSEVDDGPLDEIRDWLYAATKGGPRGVEAWLELGHFLDAVDDAPQLALPVFETALELSIDYLEAAASALEDLTFDDVTPAPDMSSQSRLLSLRERAQKILSVLSAHT